MRRFGLSLAALIAPPIAFVLAARRDRTAFALSATWVLGVIVFLSLFAGPGAILMGLSGMASAAATALGRAEVG